MERTKIKAKEFVRILHDELKSSGSDITVKIETEDQHCSSTGGFTSGRITFFNCGEKFLHLDSEGTDQTSDKPFLTKI